MPSIPDPRSSSPFHALLVARPLLVLSLGLLVSPAQAQQVPRTLFDGKSLAGWEALEADARWWNVADAAITGGSLTEDVPHNTFLATTGSFHNFDLRLKIRILGNGGFINSGIQIRSVRAEVGSEMVGYQVDVGDGWWGKLYDESRRNRVLSQAADLAAVERAVRADDWNDYRIRAEGPRIRSWINGVPALDYTEPEADVPFDGHIGIQVHGGGKVRVEVKDVTIEELPPTTGALTWRAFEKARSVSSQGTAPLLSPEEELAGFRVADGFEVELVASDPAMDKVVDIAFDDAGRMWAITAVEYPIDGNESPEAAELYARGGRDQVLVFDEPWGPGPHTPRVFADGLVIPMALLPEGDSVLVGQGPHILRLHDADGDGRADRREVVLTGFGIQDSHLLPHRFVRAPGGWIYTAQGAFNSSEVRTRSGEVVTFDKCKVGRFQADGSRFEVVGVGLNNIWGFVIDRRGDKWIQEANDLGYPVVPFEHGASYPGIGDHRFHAYSPWRPPLAEFRMGGTGLSGLALSESRGGFPAPWDRRFVVANPILSALQSVDAARSSSDPNEVTLKRGPDLLTSADENFRPVAIHFGPDDCLYVVDWYNPIISHNEVPRDHPDRDKTRSRIWRIRHESQPRRRPLDVAAAVTADLVALLDADSPVIARAAWHQIALRRAVQLEGELVALAANASARVGARVLSLWSLDDLGLASVELARGLLDDGEPALRREGVRLLGVLEPGPAELARLLAPLELERDPRVRVAAIRALGASRELDAAAAGLLLRMARASRDEPTVRLSSRNEEAKSGLAGEIAFERSLVRSILERQREALAAALYGAPGLDARTRRFAALCLGGADGADLLALDLAEAGLTPTQEELGLLAEHADEIGVEIAIRIWLSRRATRTTVLRMLLDTAGRWDVASLAPHVVTGAHGLLLDGEPTRDDQTLVLRLAETLRLAELEDDVVAILDDGYPDPPACLRALVELGSRNAELYFELANASLPGDASRRLAAGALAGVPGEVSFELLLELWPSLGASARRAALEALLTREESARRLVAAVSEDAIEMELLDGATLARLEHHLGDDPALAELRRAAARNERPVLRLSGDTGDYAATQLSLEGPFTVEAWVFLEGQISNADGLLCAPGLFDFNFHDARARLWAGPGAGDVIIAARTIEPETWTHVALTRDADGALTLYVNGVLDGVSSRPLPAAFNGLDVGRTIPGAGTNGRISELRVWSVERSAEEVGGAFRSALSPGGDTPGLVLVLPGDEVELSGAARIEGALDTPPILSAEEARAEAARFATYRALAETPGDFDRGRALFAENCAACHRVGGEGVSIGPVLDGVGSKGTEGLLRSILTPNEGVESGYRTLLVQTLEGELLSGFLASEDADSILLRRKDRQDLRIPRAEIESARMDPLSLMPEGLLEALAPDEVTDLMTYLKSLR